MGSLKRYLAPKFWEIPRKKFIFAVKPSPGPHPKDKCIPLLIILRDILQLAENSKEAKSILNAGNVLVDKKVRKDLKFPVGLMDILEIPPIKKYFRVLPSSKGLELKEIEKTSSDKKICKIIGKTILKRGRIQLNLHDSKNIIVDSKEAKKYNVGDSLIIKLPENKILKHIELKTGEFGVVVSGKNKGLAGVIKEIFNKKTMLETSTITFGIDGKEIKTLKEYVMVVDPEIIGISLKKNKQVTKKSEIKPKNVKKTETSKRIKKVKK